MKLNINTLKQAAGGVVDTAKMKIREEARAAVLPWVALSIALSLYVLVSKKKGRRR